jgi:hypothetical protein
MARRYVPWKQGEDKRGMLQTTHPDADQNTPFRALAIKVRSISSPAPDTTPPVSFVVPFTFVAATGTNPAGWQVHLTRAESLAQPTGIYRIDAAIELAGDTIITEPVFVQLETSGVRGV